jgi:predicted PurR-regulated permease PerM
LLTADREPERAPAQPAQQPDPQSPARRRLRFAPSSIVLFGAVFWAFPLIGIFFARYVNILLIVFLAVLFSTFLTPAVNALERLRISRVAGILLVYLAIIGVVAGVAWLAAPLFVNETQKLIDSWPAYVHRFVGPLRQLGITLPAGGASLSS